MNIYTRYSKNENGHNAKSEFELAGTAFTVVITTAKGNDGVLNSTVSCCKQDGHFQTYRVFQDFYKTIKREQARCTEKKITEIHLSTLEKVNSIVTEITDHYNSAEYVSKYGKE